MQGVSPTEPDESPVRVRAVNGQTGDDAWNPRRRLPLRQRLRAASRFAGLGQLLGAGFLLIPLVHLLGVLFLLVLSVMAAARLRATAVVDEARGTCPRCGQTGSFFVGLGRRRFRLPMAASCGGCGVELTLYHS